jgi:hypothetical protein
VYELERRVSYAVDAMQRNGFAINEARLAPLVEEVTKTAERLKAELEAEWGINPGSSKQLREHFKLEKREGWSKTDAGAPKTDQDAMKTLVKEEPSVAKWPEWKRVEKLRSTYGLSLQKRVVDGRIPARFNPFGTATGRFSSSGPNLQNIPKDERLRSLFWSGGRRPEAREGGLRLDRAVGGGRAVGGPLHAEGAPAGRQHARRDGRRGAVQRQAGGGTKANLAIKCATYRWSNDGRRSCLHETPDSSQAA